MINRIVKKSMQKHFCEICAFWLRRETLQNLNRRIQYWTNIVNAPFTDHRVALVVITI